MRLFRCTAFLVPLVLSACALAPRPGPLDAAALRQGDAAIAAMINQQQMPGGVWWIERAGQSYHRAYGQRALRPVPEPADEATLYDAASLTKVVVTAPLIELLREQGKLEVDAPLQRYLPACGDESWRGISLRHLLTHTAGLPAGMGAKLPNGETWSGTAGALQQACGQKLRTAPGTQFVYSDIGYILLGLVIEQVGAAPLHAQAEAQLFAPLGMNDSSYLPLQRGVPVARIAPTEKVAEGEYLRGVVHDPTARRMGGVAGHAGLFTTSSDLARYARMLLAGGLLPDGRRFLSEQSVALLSTPQSPPALKEKRALGFDVDSPYSRPRGTLYPKTSFGHTGFTGCAFWLDPGSRSFTIMLANRVHMAGPTNTLPLYEQLGTFAAQAAGVLATAAAPAAVPAASATAR